MVSGDQQPELMFGFAIYLALFAVVLATLYCAVRLAVRHAIEDADRRRAGEWR